MRITSILSVFNCVLSIPNFWDYFKSDKIKEILENDKNRDKITTLNVLPDDYVISGDDNTGVIKLEVEPLLRMSKSLTRIRQRAIEISVVSLIPEVYLA